MVKWIKRLIADWKRKRAMKKKLEELKKRDPFIYKQEGRTLMTEVTKGIYNAVKNKMDESQSIHTQAHLIQSICIHVVTALLL